MGYLIRGLDAAAFAPLFGLDDDALAARGARRHVVDEENAFPDRVSLTDLPVGARALLVNHEHLPGPGPYRASHAIYVAEDAGPAGVHRDEVPAMLRRRLLSVRAFDADSMMCDAEVLQGDALDAWIRGALADDRVAFVQVHTARRGCFLATALRYG